MYGGDCDAAIAKAAAAVTRAYRARVRRLVLVMEGLGFLCFDLSSAETDFWWQEDEQRDFVYFRVSYDILRSSWKLSSPCVPTTVVVLKQPSQSIQT